jgi:hypothetical protein
MRTVAIVTTIVAAAVITATAQQGRPDRQPGRKWSEDQLRRESSRVRAGRSLNPKAWPNGARVAVAVMTAAATMVVTIATVRMASSYCAAVLLMPDCCLIHLAISSAVANQTPGFDFM